ncbi:hypothetical protein BFS30_20235 [Pedobacter steynii]|uniref:Uncharacterized protein n=1 Tax=Pedobacter steynii TaxID=430522 RepID=A0A1D7QKW4_9SPHI|nr:hypothetical protein BFS30_20235 [Pedobacter steynii]
MMTTGIYLADVRCLYQLSIYLSFFSTNSVPLISVELAISCIKALSTLSKYPLKAHINKSLVQRRTQLVSGRPETKNDKEMSKRMR